jgi:DNA-directed RNA polymerase sigma subunit (sigma70/sigma32)
MELIHQARAYNVTLDELAKILKVSRGRVRQYEAGE